MLETVRAREYPDPGSRIFLNSASWGLMPRSSIEEVNDLVSRRNRGDGVGEAELGAIQRRCRTAAARLVGCGRDEIALSPNTSFGVNLAAALLREAPPGTIVLPAGEFPANVLPFRALEPHGFTVRIVPAGEDGLPDPERLLEALDAPDVVALALSAVQFVSGYRADLALFGSACRARDVLFFVDAIQQVGAAPFDVAEVDADIVACGGQKWLCAPWGSGFTWVRRGVQDRFSPPMVSWLATAAGADFDDMLHYSMAWRPNARKFELATLGVQDYLGLARSIEVLEEIGIETVRRHVHALHELVIEWVDVTPGVELLSPADPARRAGILTMVSPNATTVGTSLAEHGVTVSLREGALRLAPHFYNTREEISRVVDLLDAAVKAN